MCTLATTARSKDFLAGLVFLLIGVGMVVEASNYPFGTALRMGPGFFPIIIGTLLIVVGGALLGKAIVMRAAEPPTFHLRPTFFITTALLVFAYTLPRLGLVAATMLLVMITRLAFRPIHPVGALVLSAVLVVLAVVVFSYALRLPLRLWP